MNDIIEFAVEHWATVIMVVLASFLIGWLICCAGRYRSPVAVAAEEQTVKEETAKVAEAADAVSEQSHKLRIGMRRIADADDPLASFVEAITGEPIERQQRRERR